MKKQFSFIIFLSLVWINLNSMQKNLSDQLNNLVSVLTTLQQIMPRPTEVSSTKISPEKAPEPVDVKVSIDDAELLKKYSEAIKNLIGDIPEEEEAEEVTIALRPADAQNIEKLIEYMRLIDNDQYQEIKRKSNLETLDDIIDLIFSADFLGMENDRLFADWLEVFAEQFLSILDANPEMVTDYEKKIELFPDHIKSMFINILITKINPNIISDIIARNETTIPDNIRDFAWSFDDDLAAASRITDFMIIKNKNGWNKKPFNCVGKNYGLQFPPLYRYPVAHLAWNKHNILALACPESLSLWKADVVESILQGGFSQVGWNDSGEYLAALRYDENPTRLSALPHHENPTLFILTQVDNKWTPKRQFKTNQFSWSKSGNYLAFISESKLIIWDVTKDTIITVADIKSRTNFHWEHGDYLMAVTENIKDNKIWYLTEKNSWNSMEFILPNAEDITWSPTKDMFAIINKDKSLSIGTIDKQKKITSQPLPSVSNVTTVIWDTERMLIVGSQNGLISILNEKSDKSWELVNSFLPEIHTDPIMELAPGPDNFLAIRSTSSLYLGTYKENSWKLYFKYEYKYPENRPSLQLLFWSHNRKNLAVKTSHKKSTTIKIFSNLNVDQLLKGLSLEEVIVYNFHKKLLPLPPKWPSIRLPYFLHKTIWN